MLEDNTTCQKFLGSLRLTDPLDDLEATRRVKGVGVKGTCKWLLAENKYVAWKVGDKPQLLWLVGGPGIGKTMISSFLVGELERKAGQDSAMTLAYYFCDNKDESRNTASALLRGLLLQLLRKRPILFKHVKKDYYEMKDRLPELLRNLDSLWRIFRSMLKDHDAGNVYILVDALDECEKSSQKAFLTHLKRLFTGQQLDGNVAVKFLITCRPEQEIEDTLRDDEGRDVGERLRMDSPKINSDLFKFIDVKVDELSSRKGYPVELKQEIKVVLTEQAGGTFLWASLVLDDISRTKVTSKVRAKLLELPSSLGQVYNRILKGIDDESREDAILILQLVVIARRPLTNRELAMARAVGPGKWKENKNMLPPARVLNELRDDYRCCEPLLYQDTETDTINLVHQSAKDYLLSSDLQVNKELSRYHIVADKTNLLVFQICWRYLSMEEFDQGRTIIKRDEKNCLKPAVFPRECLDSYSFLQYACQEWQEHALAASSALMTDCKFEQDGLEKASTLRDSWLLRAAEEGHEAVVQLLLENGAELYSKDSGSRTPLSLAAGGGHEAVVRLLLEKGAELDSKDFFG